MRVLGKYAHGWCAGQVDIQRFGVLDDFLQLTLSAVGSIGLHEGRRVLRDIDVMSECMTDVGGCAVGQLHRFVAFQAVQGQDLADQVRCVDRPHAQCIAGLVPDAGVRQIDLDVFDILFGVARGDLLAYRQAGGERLLSRPDLCSRGLGGGHGGISRLGEASQVAGRVQGSRGASQRKRARECSRKGPRRARAVAGGGLNTTRGGSCIVSAQLLQYRRDGVDPCGGSGLEIQIAVTAVMQSVCA